MEKYFHWTIRIHQKILSVLAPNLSVIDGALLSYLYSLSRGKNIKRETFKDKIFFKNEKELSADGHIKFFWCKHSAVIKQMPMLKIKSKSAIQKRMKKLEESGFIIRYTNKRFESYVYLAEKSRLVWVNELPGKKCYGCKKFCEECEIFSTVEIIEFE